MVVITELKKKEKMSYTKFRIMVVVNDSRE